MGPPVCECRSLQRWSHLPEYCCWCTTAARACTYLTRANTSLTQVSLTLRCLATNPAGAPSTHICMAKTSSDTDREPLLAALGKMKLRAYKLPTPACLLEPVLFQKISCHFGQHKGGEI